MYFTHHLGCVAGFDRQNPEADVPQDFGEHAANPKHDHRAKLRVIQQADDDLDAPGYHLLDFNTLDAGFGVSCPYRSHNAVKGLAHRVRAFHVEHYAPHIRLMQDVRREDL